MLVYREEGATKEEDVFETMDVQMVKKPGKGLGLSIVGRKNGPGVFISDVVSRRRDCSEGEYSGGTRGQIIVVGVSEIRESR